MQKKYVGPISNIVGHPSTNQTCIFNFIGGWLWLTHNGFTHDKYEDILLFDKVVHQWRKIGSMKMTRYHHAMSVINYNEVADYCN